MLGPHCKYSACFWGKGIDSLEQAEEATLEMTCERAGMADGQRILELGCGWGSLSLYMAARYPRAAVVAVSNSKAQREYVLREARRRQLSNPVVLTRDMNEFTTEGRFDRIVSVEMFEHMRNYAWLFGNIRDRLMPNGKFFMHIFVHRNSPYEFVDRNADDWMSRYFFSGGMMPSAALPLYFQDHLRLQRQWSCSGLHYARTANAWLTNLDAHRAQVLPVLAEVYGPGAAEVWLQRWRIFFMAGGIWPSCKADTPSTKK